MFPVTPQTVPSRCSLGDAESLELSQLLTLDSNLLKHSDSVILANIHFTQSAELRQIKIWSEQLVFIPALNCSDQAQDFFRVHKNSGYVINFS